MSDATSVASVMLCAIRAELTKILTLPGTWLVTAVILGLDVLVLTQPADLFAEAVANITSNGLIEVFVGKPEPAREAILGLLVASSLQIGLFLPVLAAVMAGQEFRSHQIGLTVLAVAGRTRLFVAKILAAGFYFCFVAVVIAGISTAFMYAAIRNWNPGLLVSEVAFIGHGKFVVFAVLFSLTAFALTIIARSALMSIYIMLGLVAVTMTQVLAGIAPDLDALFPLSAGRNLLLNAGVNRLTASPEHGLFVLIGWTLTTTVLAGILLGRRDAV